MQNKIILLIGLIISNIFVTQSKITINELMSKNVSYKMYKSGNVYGFAGLVELHNEDTDSIDLKGYKFLDHQGHSWECDSSIIMAPDSFTVIWFSELNKGNHASFKLDAEGGFLTLKNVDDEVVEEFEYPEGKRNLSYGNIEDGNEKDFFTMPSLGFSNKGSHIIEKLPSNPSFNYKAGFYSDSIKLEITSDEDCEIRFTTNGSEPTVSDSIYTKPLDLNKNTVVRAISVKKIEIDSLDSLINDFHLVKSEPVSSTYFIGERDIKLPIVSLSVDSLYMFDEEYGIYVVGNGRYPQKYSGWTDLPYANYWGDEKRPVNIEFFDTAKNQQINQEIGIGIYGGYSRSYDKKSLKLNPSKIYGDNQFRYTLFKSKSNIKIKSILLRSSGQDFFHSYMRDGFIASLVENDIDVDMQAYTPCVVYLNGNYFGLMNLRERHNEDYIYSNYGLDKDSITQSLSHSSKFEKLKKCDINSDAAKMLIDSLFDVDEILNFTLTQIYCANTDWGENNVTFWSRKNEEYWRTILYDTDEGFSNFGDKSNLNTISYAYKNSTLKLLLGNDSVRRKLFSKAIVHLTTTFDPIRVEHILDSLSSTIKDEAINYQIYRKNAGLWCVDWNKEISKMHDFAKVRPKNVFAHIRNYYSLGDTSSIKLFAEELGTEFYFNDERIKTNCFDSYCFEGFDISLKCCPPDNFLFDHWEITTEDSVYTSFEEELITVFSEKTSYHAILKEDTINNKQTELPILYLNEICITNKTYIDEFRESDDWIEIYNASSHPVDLAGMYLSDKKGNLTKSMIPLDNPEKTTVAGKSYIVFWADNSVDQGANHLGFSLSSSKRQTVTLSTVISDSVVVLDSIKYEFHEKGETYARFSYDDNGKWTKTKWPTFAAPNRLMGYDIANVTIEDTIPKNIEDVASSKNLNSNILTSVSPNPTKDVIYVTFPCESVSYSIYSNGLSYKKGILKNGQSLDLCGLPTGLYILSLWNSNIGFYDNIKIIKQ